MGDGSNPEKPKGMQEELGRRAFLGRLKEWGKRGAVVVGVASAAGMVHEVRRLWGVDLGKLRSTPIKREQEADLSGKDLIPDTAARKEVTDLVLEDVFPRLGIGIKQTEEDTGISAENIYYRTPKFIPKDNAKLERVARYMAQYSAEIQFPDFLVRLTTVGPQYRGEGAKSAVTVVTCEYEDPNSEGKYIFNFRDDDKDDPRFGSNGYKFPNTRVIRSGSLNPQEVRGSIQKQLIAAMNQAIRTGAKIPTKEQWLKRVPQDQVQ